MRRLIIIPLLFICLILSAQDTYYVSPTGDDDDPGTFAEPWKTVGKAFTTSEVSAGDTVYFRGGVYYKTLDEDASYYYADGKGAYKMLKSGTSDNWIYFWAYPPDYEAGNPPIFDSDNVDPPHNQHHFLRWSGNYIHFKGLVIRNVWSDPDGYVRPDNTPSGSIQSYRTYEAQVASIVYMGNTYDPGERFQSVSGYTTYTGSGEAHWVESVECFGWEGQGENTIVENCTAYNIHGIGFRTGGAANQIFRNCDAYHCCDSFPIYPQLLGQRGTGFSNQNIYNYSSTVYYQNCRAWLCSDQGYACNTYGLADYNGCWSFANGMLSQGGGIGFKTGWWERSTSPSEIKRRVTNCLMAYNRECGISTNDSGEPNVCGHVYYNNTIYKSYDIDWPSGGYGIYVYNTNDTDEHELYRVFRNNISYANEVGPIYTYNAVYTHSNNSWDGGATITAEDFQALPATDEAGVTLLSGNRGTDGSLPDLGNYFHLTSTSDAKNAGIDVGLTYDADSVLWDDPPSIGAFEYAASGVGPLVVFTTTVYPHTDWALAGGNVYDDGGGNIDARGVCWSESENPTIANSHTSDGTGTGVYSSTLTGLLEGTIYHARAYAHNEVGYGYGVDVEFETLTSGGGETIVFHNGKMIFHNGKIIMR